MIVTGEASGDMHGANLIKAAGEVDPGLQFFGVGGSDMEAAGCEILIPGEELAVMGIVEVFGHFSVIWQSFQKLKKILHSPERPDALVLIDFPEFNLRLAKQAKKAGVPVLYYVSPQVWAWRRGRVKKIARVVDRLAAIFPFEPELYQGLDIDVAYVGHPLLDELHEPCDRIEFLESIGVSEDKRIVGLFPGSRRSEIDYMFDTLLESGIEIIKYEPDCHFLVPLASTLKQEELQKRLELSGLPATLVHADVYDTISACEAIISVSGTVTLQIALIGTPMAILYKMASLTYLVGRLLVKVDHIGLANIVAGRQVAREFIQDQASPDNLAREVVRVLQDETYRETLQKGLAGVQQRMGEPGCSIRVAKMLSEMCPLKEDLL
jgi:lipid-A-disaccharide synthase